MTRRQSLALDPRPTGLRARAADRLLAVLRWLSAGLDRASGLTPPATPPASFNRPGPSEDTAAMQTALPDVHR